MKTSELLIQAKALISDEKNWTKHSFARNERGEMVDSLSERATCFCSIGALNRISGEFLEREVAYSHAFNLLASFAGVTDILDIVKFNDTHTHEEVMAVWNKAISSAIEQGE